MIYIAGSLRNPEMLAVQATLQLAFPNQSFFMDWFCAGPEADDHWKRYHQEQLGLTYTEALQFPASKNVYNFDKRHIDLSDTMILVLPAGKSGHLELGYAIGQGKKAYILLDDKDNRWDVMYQFATAVCLNIKQLIFHLECDAQHDIGVVK